ncbi:hypothetical protein Peur_034722 [Populus x canadensis]
MIVLESTYTETQIHSQKVAERGGGANPNFFSLFSQFLKTSYPSPLELPESPISLCCCYPTILIIKSSHSNLVFSPPSLQVLLNLIAVGSKGPTHDKLLSILKFKTNDHLSSSSSMLLMVVFTNESTDILREPVD